MAVIKTPNFWLPISVEKQWLIFHEECWRAGGSDLKLVMASRKGFTTHTYAHTQTVLGGRESPHGDRSHLDVRGMTRSGFI